MKNLGSKLTYSNVISTLCLFLVLGGGTAFAATQLGKNSVGAKQLKKNAVTAAKLKDGAVTGSKIQMGTLGTVPSAASASHATSADSATHATTADSATRATTATTAANSTTTDALKGSKGTLGLGQTATVLQVGALSVTAECKEISAGRIGELFLIASSTPGSAFSSWSDGSRELGPATAATDRELNRVEWAASSGAYAYDSAADMVISASAASGPGFNAEIGEATEANTNTCWYWVTADLIN
jgi:hypothetical protein